MRALTYFVLESLTSKLICLGLHYSPHVEPDPAVTGWSCARSSPFQSDIGLDATIGNVTYQRAFIGLFTLPLDVTGRRSYIDNLSKQGVRNGAF
jgi:hypothetical protein